MPYTIHVDPHNKVVKTLRNGHPGNCLRIIGGIPRPSSSDPKKRQMEEVREQTEQAILIHECPSIGWVVGCIGPRPIDERRIYDNVDGNPSHKALNEIYDQVNRAGGTASLVVLDWG